MRHFVHKQIFVNICNSFVSLSQFFRKLFVRQLISGHTKELRTFILGSSVN